MANILEYKGYQTRVEFDAESFVLYGKIEGICDLVNFEADSIKEVEKSFHEAVDDYLQFCQEVNKNPDKAYNGQFNVRISPQLHRKLAMRAHRDGETLNKEVQIAIESFLGERLNIESKPIFIINPEAHGKSKINSRIDRVSKTYFSSGWTDSNQVLRA